jgi:hypothetical protein
MACGTYIVARAGFRPDCYQPAHQEGAVSDSTVDVTVHIDETLDHARLESVAERVRKGVGIASAVFHDTRPHFLLVRYDPAKIGSDAVFRMVTDQGVHAELIGI